MVELSALWLPILVAALAVFVVSAAMWTLMPHHKTDWSPLPNEDQVLEVLRAGGVGRGQWFFPRALTSEHVREEGAQEKIARGPIGYLTIQQPGAPSMPRMMGLGLLKDLAVMTLVAYAASVALPYGADYADVLRLVFTVVLLAYSAAEVSNSIWFASTWSSTWKRVLDAAVYGVVAGGVFGWLWPGA